MKTLLSLIYFSFVLSLSVLSQDHKISFGCYEGGESSSSVLKFRQLLENREYVVIGELLLSDDNAEKVLAVVAMEKLSEAGSIKLTSFQKQLIKGIKISKSPIFCCSGCMGYEETTLRKYFEGEEAEIAYYWVNNYMTQ